jgi:hypothetical protein
MPGHGRPADPLWTAIGLTLGVVPGFYFHQIGAGVGIGIALGCALGLIREDRRADIAGLPTPYGSVSGFSSVSRSVFGCTISDLLGVWASGLDSRLDCFSAPSRESFAQTGAENRNEKTAISQSATASN